MRYAIKKWFIAIKMTLSTAISMIGEIRIMRILLIIFCLLTTLVTEALQAKSLQNNHEYLNACRSAAQVSVYNQFGFNDYLDTIATSENLKPTGFSAIFSSYFKHNPKIFNYFREGAIFLHFPDSEDYDVMAIYNPFFDMALVFSISPASYDCESLEFTKMEFDFLDILAGETVRGEQLPPIDYPYPQWYKKYGSYGVCKDAVLNIGQLSYSFLRQLKNYSFQSSKMLTTIDKRTYVENVRLMAAYTKHKPAMNKSQPQLKQYLKEKLNSIKVPELVQHWKALPFNEVFSICDNKKCTSGVRYYRSDDLSTFACTAFSLDQSNTLMSPVNVSADIDSLSYDLPSLLKINSN